jgi:hypothetical protein
MAKCTCADPTAVARAIKEASSVEDSNDNAQKQSFDEFHKSFYGEGLGPDAGTPGAPAPVRFCRWAAPEVTDAGNSAWANAFRAASIAIAIANGLAQAEIADKQMDLATGYYDQAKFKWDRFREKYMPLEKQLLQEVSTPPVREMDCAGAENRADLSVGLAYAQIGDMLGRYSKKVRICVDPSLMSRMNTEQGLQLTDSMNYNLVDERWYTDYKNDQRWNRRSNVLNLGRNLSSEALKYGEVARSLYGQVGAQIDRAASGLMQALGYYGARNDTMYPTTYLSGGGSNLVSIGTPASSNPAASGGTNPAM